MGLNSVLNNDDVTSKLKCVNYEGLKVELGKGFDTRISSQTLCSLSSNNKKMPATVYYRNKFLNPAYRVGAFNKEPMLVDDWIEVAKVEDMCAHKYLLEIPLKLEFQEVPASEGFFYTKTRQVVAIYNLDLDADRNFLKFPDISTSLELKLNLNQESMDFKRVRVTYFLEQLLDSFSIIRLWYAIAYFLMLIAACSFKRDEARKQLISEGRKPTPDKEDLIISKYPALDPPNKLPVTTS